MDCFAIINFVMNTILRHTWGYYIWAFYHYRIQGMAIILCFVFVHIPVYHIFTILRHGWGCNIWTFLYYLIQGILISLWLIFINIHMYCIFTFLHHIWGYYIGSVTFPFLCYLDNCWLHFHCYQHVPHLQFPPSYW